MKRAYGRLISDETKTDTSDAVVPLPKITHAVLLEHQEHQAQVRDDAGELWTDHDLVFTTSTGTPIEPRSLNTHWEGIRVQAGLPGVRLHDRRHTVVSLLLELGMPPHVVQAIARYADLDVTMRIYAHTNLDTIRQALDKIDWDAGCGTVWTPVDRDDGQGRAHEARRGRRTRRRVRLGRTVTVVISAQDCDAPVDQVIRRLTEREVPVFWADTSWFPQRLTIDARLESERWTGCLSTDHHRVDLDDIRSIWYRDPTAFDFPANLSQPERWFAFREARLGRGGVLASLGTLWVNHPNRASGAIYKPLHPPRR